MSTARRRRLDALKDVDVHDGYSAVMRARLIKANGNAANHVMITVASLGRLRPTPYAGLAVGPHFGRRWPTRPVADQHRQRQVGSASKEGRSQQAGGLVDTCYPAVAGPQIESWKVTDQERCGFLPVLRDAAGAGRRRPTMSSNARSAADPADYSDAVGRANGAVATGVPVASMITPAGCRAGTPRWHLGVVQGGGEFVALEPGR